MAKVVYGVPKVGFVVVMANSQIGWTLFIIGPAVVLFLMWYWEREHKKVANR
ncbi:MAG: hypothetical protein HY532_07350 [Chloroflexi bacterium]|nr:hypothetical protein [Chloroflexota bacterium]